MKCPHCKTECVNGRLITEKERFAVRHIAPLGSDYVGVCPKCYPEKVNKGVSE